jgi:hypothetical protein
MKGVRRLACKVKKCVSGNKKKSWQRKGDHCYGAQVQTRPKDTGPRKKSSLMRWIGACAGVNRRYLLPFSARRTGIASGVMVKVKISCTGFAAWS